MVLIHCTRARFYQAINIYHSVYAVSILKRISTIFVLYIVILLDGVGGETVEVVNVYKRWKIGNIGYIVGLQRLKWQQIGNTIGNNRQQSATIGNNWQQSATIGE